MLRRQETNQVKPPPAEHLQLRGAVLLDLRGDDEWAAGQARGAEHMPLARVSNETSHLESKDVLTLCRGGSRSGRAADILGAAGVNLRNVAGGMSATASAGLLVVRDDGAPGTVA